MKNGFFLSISIGLLSMSAACHQSMKAKDSAPMPGVKAQVTYTAMVRSEQDLPRCDSGTNGMRAYLKADDSFLKCENFAWQGSRPGNAVGRFAAREPIRYNEWRDEKANRRWSTAGRDEIEASSLKGEVCQKGFVLPTSAELKTASVNGLFDGLKAHGGIGFDKAWTAEKAAFAGISRGESEELKDIKVKAGVYCVGPV